MLSNKTFLYSRHFYKCISHLIFRLALFEKPKTPSPKPEPTPLHTKARERHYPHFPTKSGHFVLEQLKQIIMHSQFSTPTQSSATTQKTKRTQCPTTQEELSRNKPEPKTWHLSLLESPLVSAKKKKSTWYSISQKHKQLRNPRCVSPVKTKLTQERKQEISIQVPEPLRASQSPKPSSQASPMNPSSAPFRSTATRITRHGPLRSSKHWIKPQESCLQTSGPVGEPKRRSAPLDTNPVLSFD